MKHTRVPRLGAWRADDSVEWRVWAPDHERLDVVLYGPDGKAEMASLPLKAEGNGFFATRLREAPARVLYKIRVDNNGPFPDPWSRSQPYGVHGPSEVLAPSQFRWRDTGWRGLPIEDLVIYEVHVGTATTEGTFDALIGKLDTIRSVGVTAIELMPLASFPGSRGWGYDGVTLNAVQASYGGPEGLERFVDAAHARGLAVLVDVVYNHFGPDGNYLACYSKSYFTHRHRTPWGDGINYDGPGSATTRELILRNAEMWIRDFHVDGLRLDATHSIQDDSPVHIVQEVGILARAAAPQRTVLVIAEDERNQAKLLQPITEGGYGMDAVWADDFHHSMRRAFAGDHDGYFGDFAGSPSEIATTIEQGWFFTGQPAAFYGSKRGTLSDGIELPRFVHCIQNHDQIGNRAFGDRLSTVIDDDAFKTMTALLLFSPETPLLFMGQEWNASTPFLFFTDHNAELGKAVTAGRRREFEKFKSFASEEIPDPQSPHTFERSKLNWNECEEPVHKVIWEWYRALLSLRATHPCLRDRRREQVVAQRVGDQALAVTRRNGKQSLTLVASLRGRAEVQPGARLVLSSEDKRFGGRIGGAMAIVYEH